MLDRPEYWQSHYHGDGNARRPPAVTAIPTACAITGQTARLTTPLSGWYATADEPIPLPLISQYLPLQYSKVRDGALSSTPRELILDHIQDILHQYHAACEGVTTQHA